jgi:hypothetical protein
VPVRVANQGPCAALYGACGRQVRAVLLGDAAAELVPGTVGAVRGGAEVDDL